MMLLASSEVTLRACDKENTYSCVKVTGQGTQRLEGQQWDDMYILDCNSFVCVCVWRVVFIIVQSRGNIRFMFTS